MKKIYQTPRVDLQRPLHIETYMQVPSAGETLPGTEPGGKTEPDPSTPYDPDAKERNAWEEGGLW